MKPWILKEVQNSTPPNWRLDINGTKIDSEQEVADHFNKYFVDKIQKLKDSIDPEYVCDPLEKLKTKHENNQFKFNLKTVTKKQVEKIIKKLKKKKSVGSDGLSQEHLINGKQNLIPPLTKIFNNSIEEG